MPGWPAVPMVLTLSMIVVIYENVKADRVPVIVTLGIFLIGFPNYHSLIRPHSAERWTPPDPADEEIV